MKHPLARLRKNRRLPIRVANEPSPDKRRMPFPLFRLIFSICIGGISLWIVAIANGTLETHHDDKRLSLGVWVPRSGSSVLSKDLDDKKLFVSSRLETYTYWTPPNIFKRWIPRTNRADSDIWAGEWADAKIYIEFWKDPDCTIPADIVKMGIPALRFEIFSSRELVSAENPAAEKDPDSQVLSETVPEFGNSLIQRVYETLGIGPTLFQHTAPEELVFEYDVRSRQAQSNSYSLDLEFKSPLEGGLGLAQLEWSQLLSARNEAETSMKVISTVRFDQLFDDVKASPGPYTDNASAYRTKAEAVALPRTKGHSEKDKYLGGESALLNISATSSPRRNWVDFIVFTMAALFGAASASIFDMVSNIESRSRVR